MASESLPAQGAKPRLRPMLKNDYADQNCSVARTLEAIGERWTLLIVRDLLVKPSRFSWLERHLAISKNMLATRLEKLVSLGIAEKVSYDQARDWNTYRLTRKGSDLYPVISALMAWGDVYDAPYGAPAYFEHTCGHAAGHTLVCQACGLPVDGHTVKGQRGPGWKVDALRQRTGDDAIKTVPNPKRQASGQRSPASRARSK